jgi:hypothetical protein
MDLSRKHDGERKIDLTIYSQDFALVRERRKVELTKGRNRLTLADVSRQLDPHSILLGWESKARSAAPEIVAHSYDLGANAAALLKHQIGKPVEVVRYDTNGREASRQQGKLLVSEGGYGNVVEIGGKLYVNPVGTLVVPGGSAVPTIPRLTVQVESGAAQSPTLDLAYLTRGLRWSADYVATLAKDADDRLDVECYAAVTNRTGVQYPNAAVTLAAGSPSRAVRVAEEEPYRWYARSTLPPPPLGPRVPPPARQLPAPPAEVDFEAASAPESVAEFHAYPLKRPATVYGEQLSRLPLMRRDGLKVKKDYSYRTPYLEVYSSSQEEQGKVAVALSFTNTGQEGMGVPLPAGTVRVYGDDALGRLRYAGAAQIPPTPAGKKVTVSLATAFDLTAEYKTVSSKQMSRRKVRKQVQVVLRNAKLSAVTVRVVQGFYGDWGIVSASHKHAKLDSSTAQWTIPVPAGGKTTLAFAADLAW